MHIDDPKIVGVIKECGGKMYMSEKKWDEALNQFWASFTSLVDSGSPHAVTVLKYVILTQILSNSETDQLTQNEAQVYKDDPQIIAMKDFKQAVAENNI